jgi:hypothetical protein
MYRTLHQSSAATCKALTDVSCLVLHVTKSPTCASRILHEQRGSTKLTLRLPSLRGCFCCLEWIADLLSGLLAPMLARRLAAVKERCLVSCSDML